VTTFTVLIMRAGGRASAAAEAEQAALVEREVPEVLQMLALKDKPQGVRDLVAAFLRFTQEEMPGLTLQQKANYLKGIDLSRWAEAGTETLSPGTRLVAYVEGPEGQLGNWLTKPGTPTEQIGISSGAGSTARVQRVYVVTRPLKVFRSQAIATVDSWTKSRTPQVQVGIKQGVIKDGEWVAGGGVQYFVKDRSALQLVEKPSLGK
jgi:hypothetical protein